MESMGILLFPTLIYMEHIWKMAIDMRLSTKICGRKDCRDGNAMPYYLYVNVESNDGYPTRNIFARETSEGSEIDLTWDGKERAIHILCTSFEQAQEFREDILRQISNFLTKWDSHFPERADEKSYVWSNGAWKP